MPDPEPLYRIVEDDPEYGEYRDLTENKYQPLPDGVLRWYSNQHHVYASPDGYLVPVKVPDTRLQAIVDAPRCEMDDLQLYEYIGLEQDRERFERQAEGLLTPITIPLYRTARSHERKRQLSTTKQVICINNVYQ